MKMNTFWFHLKTHKYDENIATLEIPMAERQVTNENWP